MLLIRYFFLAALVLAVCNNLTAFGLSSLAKAPIAQNNNNSEDDTNIDSTNQNSENRRTEKQKRQDLISQLNLSNEQRQKIIGIRNKYQKQIGESRNNLTITQKELKEMLAGNNSPDAIRNRHEKAANYRQQLSDLTLERMLEIREILTEEQRSKFILLMQSRGTVTNP
jgi:Spy/CpxP family protein refolding chaperone